MKVVCLVTISDAEQGKALARKLLEMKLVACVNVVPAITSLYWWEGKICEDSEALLILKTTQHKVDHLVKAVKAHHPYSVPEVISMAIDQGNPDYLQWVEDSVSQSG